MLSKLRIKNQLVREFLAELISTFILITFGDGCVAQVVLSRGQIGSSLSIHFGWAFAVTVGVYFSAGITGGHMNPAVTLAMFSIKKLTISQTVVYIAGQFVGAFLGAAAVFFIYIDAINNLDGGSRQILGVNGTAGIFATYPAPWLSFMGGMWDQIFSTCLLLMCICALTDQRNGKPPAGTEPVLVGLSVFLIGVCFNLNCGYAINPARDLSPRIFTMIAGWGTGTFVPYGMQYWLIPVIGPILGGLLGVWIYELAISLHHPPLVTSKAKLDAVVNSSALPAFQPFEVIAPSHPNEAVAAKEDVAGNEDVAATLL